MSVNNGGVAADPLKLLLQSRGSYSRIVALIFSCLALALAAVSAANLNSDWQTIAGMARQYEKLTLPNLLYAASDSVGAIGMVLAYALPIFIVLSIASAASIGSRKYTNLLDLLTLIVAVIIAVSGVAALVSTNDRLVELAQALSGQNFNQTVISPSFGIVVAVLAALFALLAFFRSRHAS